MKKVICLLLLFATLAQAQELASLNTESYKTAKFETTVHLLTKEDFKFSDGRMLVEALPCKIKNAENTNNVLVSVVCQLSAFNLLGVDKINDMIVVANEKIRLSLKQEHRYLPKEIKMAYIPDSHDWSLTGSFLEMDNQGLLTERLLAVDFDANGKFAVMKKIL